MKVYFKNLFVFILIISFMSSCDSNLNQTGDPNNEESIEDIISHFFALNNRVVEINGNDTIRLRTVRFRDTVKIFLDSSVPADHITELKEMVNTVEQTIFGSGVSFTFVNDTNDYSIGIVNGTQQYLYERFNLGVPPDIPAEWVGSCGKITTCNTIDKAHLWYSGSSARGIQILRHEFGHAIGMGHAEWFASLMQHEVNGVFTSSKLTSIDLKVLKLMYYDGELGITAPLQPIDSCDIEKQRLFPHHVDDFKMFLKEVINNDYN